MGGFQLWVGFQGTFFVAGRLCRGAGHLFLLASHRLGICICMYRFVYFFASVKSNKTKSNKAKNETTERGLFERNANGS